MVGDKEGTFSHRHLQTVPETLRGPTYVKDLQNNVQKVLSTPDSRVIVTERHVPPPTGPEDETPE